MKRSNLQKIYFKIKTPESLKSTRNRKIIAAGCIKKNVRNCRVRHIK